MDAGAQPLFAWDGGRGFAFAAGGESGMGLVLALFAHTDAAQSLTALWEGEAGSCAVLLPEGCRSLELHLIRGGLPAGIVAVELDELLLPDFVAADLPGLRRTAWSAAESLSVVEGEPPPGIHLCLDLAQSGLDGFSRRRIGPLHDPHGPGRRVGVRAEGEEGVLRLRFANAAAADVLVAQVIGAAKDGGGTDLRRFGDAPDLLGAPPFVYWQRGFRLLAPEPASDGGGALALQPFENGDKAIVLTPRGWLAGWDDEESNGAGERPLGSRMFISAKPEGGMNVRAVFSAYRPASATALAAIGGGLSAQHGAVASASLADMAADLAAALWRRSRRPTAATDASPLTSAVTAPPPPDLPPLAHLTRAGGAAADGLSPVLAAIGRGQGLGAAAIEELDGLTAADRVALALWFVADPATARQAVAQRILLPSPAMAPARERIAAVLGWCADPERGERIERAAAALAAAGRRDELLALRRAAEAIGEAWLPFAEAAAAETLVPPASEAEASAAGPADALLARLKRDAGALAAAQAEARGLDLAALAERRSRLAETAEAAGEPPALSADLARRLASLTAVEIALVHRHLQAMAARRRRLAAIRDAVDRLDAAAGAEGLARRMDRGGDPLIGMTRLGSASEAAVRALTQAPAAHPALAALTAFVDRHAPAGEDALLSDLRRNLLSYGCLLLSQAVAREAVRAGAADDPARRERLLSGSVETLPALIRAAAEALPEGARLGASLTDRLGAPS